MAGDQRWVHQLKDPHRLRAIGNLRSKDPQRLRAAGDRLMGTSLASLKASTEDQLNREKSHLKVVLWRLYNSHMLLLAFENGIDSLYYSLYGIEGATEPISSEPQDTYEKLRICEEKLVFLDNELENIVYEDWMSGEQEKLTELIEKAFGENQKSKQIMDLVDYEMQDDIDYIAAGSDGVLTREEIKRRSELLVQDKTTVVRRVKKKGRKQYVSKKKVVC